jgi:DNA-binding transcriptional ArsR family regulator
VAPVDEPLSPEVLHALAHPLRVAALVALEERERHPAELAAVLGITEPELMHHLHLLDSAHLVTTSRETRALRVRTRGWAAIAVRLQRLQEDSR